jgi:hypothetical protein
LQGVALENNKSGSNKSQGILAEYKDFIEEKNKQKVIVEAENQIDTIQEHPANSLMCTLTQTQK